MLVTNPPQKQRNKFNFSDFHLAHFCHLHIKGKLIHYDFHSNGKFSQRQIKMALTEILGESQQSLQQTVYHVLRYDGDNDGSVTYEEFVKFCFEEYFGKMAIERMNLKNECDSAAKKSMNIKQFKEILHYGFNRLQCQVKDYELSFLFTEFDKDRDGLISFEDYSVFLKEYFCNKAIDPANDDRQPVINDESYKRSLVRIGKLIFPQIRNLIVEQDSQMKMSVNQEELKKFIEGNFMLPHIFKEIPQRLLPINSNEVSYEVALKIVLQEIFIKCVENCSSNNPLSNEKFVERFFQNELYSVRIRPPKYLIDEIYQYFSKNSFGSVTQQTYVKFLSDIVKVYNPENRELV